MRRTTSLSTGMPKAQAICWAMRGQPQKGLRCLVATIASMSSWEGPLGPGLRLHFGEKSRRYLRLVQDLVKVQQGRRFQNDGRTDQPGRPHEQSAPSGDDAIRLAEIGSALARAIEDQQLMFDKDGLSNYGTDAARTRK